MRRFTVAVTTDGSGNATAYTPRLSGKVAQIEYVKDGGANPFANGVDFNIIGEKTGIPLWVENDVNATAVRAPRQPTHSTAGAAALYAASGTAVQAQIALGNDRVKIQVSSGGATKVGAFHILVE